MDKQKQPRIVAVIGYGNKLAKHLYEVGTDKGIVEVHTNTRAMARRNAERAGYVVRDVNMVG